MNIIFLYVGIFIMLISGCGNINQIKVTSNKWVNELPLKNDVSTKDLKWNLEKIPATNTELESYFNMFDLGFIRFISVNKKMNTAVISGDENRYYIIDLTSNKVIYKYSTQSKIVNCFFDEINNEVIVVDGLRQIYRTSLNSNVTSFENEGRYSGVFFYSDTGFLSYKLIPNSIVENKTGKIVYELVVPKVDKEVIHACKEKGTFSPNNSYFACTGSRMRKLPGRNQVQSYDVINIWSIKNKRFLAELDLNEFRGVHNELRQITFTTDESRLITSYASGEMYIHNLNHSTVKSKKIQFKSFISGFAISPNDKYAYVIEDHDAAWSINLENGTQTKVAKLPEAFSSVPAFINNDEVVIGSQNSSIFKHNLKYNKVTRIGGSINLIYTISKNAKTLVTYNKETSRLCVFNNESFDKLWCNVSLPNAHIKISPDGSRFAIANQNDFIIYDSSSSEYTHKETLTNTGFPNVFAFNNAGTKLIFGSQPIRIYDISSKNYIYDNSLLKIGCGLRTFINVVALSNKDILAFSCLENNTDRYKIYTLDLTEGSSQLQINRVRVESSAILEFDFEGSKLIAAGNAVVYGGTALCLIDFNKAISECSKGIGISGDKTPYISATAFNSNNNIITAGYKTNLISYSLDVSSKSGNNLLKEGISNYYRSATSIGLNSHNVAFVAADNGVHAINLKNGENLYSLYVNQHSDIFAYNSFGYFYTSNVEYNDLTLKINNKSIDLRLFWDVFYRPDLIKQAQTNDIKINNFLNITKALQNPPPVISIAKQPTSINSKRLKIPYIITPDNGGIAEVRIFHNGKLISSDGTYKDAPGKAYAPVGGKNAEANQYADAQRSIRNAGLLETANSAIANQVGSLRNQLIVRGAPEKKCNPCKGEIEIDVIPGDENTVSVVAFNRDNTIQSVPASVTFKSTLPKEEPHLWLLSVGINQFQGITPLVNAKKDALDFACTYAGKAALTKIGLNCSEAGRAQSLFKPQNIHVVDALLDNKATKANITGALDKIASQAKPGDTFVWFVASHGMMDANSLFGIVAHDTKCLNDKCTDISGHITSNEILEASKKIKAMKQLMVLDTCHSGGLDSKMSGLYDARMSLLAKNMGLHMYASAQATEQAQDGIPGANGTFTAQLLEGIKGAAPKNSDGLISVMTLGQYAKQKTIEATQTKGGANAGKAVQTPVIQHFGLDAGLVGLGVR